MTSYDFNDGVLHYTDTGIDLDVYIDTNGISVEGIVVEDVHETLNKWIDTIKAADPQSYFDAFSDEIKQKMVCALSIDGFSSTLHSMLN